MYNKSTSAIKMKHTCGNCHTSWNTKQTFELHKNMCNFIHTTSKERAIDDDYHKMALPSHEAMFHYILHLTNKYQQLDEKVAKLQKSTTSVRRKHIADYIATLQKPDLTYAAWLETVEVTNDHLDNLFVGNLNSCIKGVLETYMKTENMPIIAFYQKPNYFYLYDVEWRLMTQDEVRKMVSVISHRVLKKYVKWAHENKHKLEGSPKAEELAMIYMSKANGLNSSIESRVLDIKKWLFARINVSLKFIDF